MKSSEERRESWRVRVEACRSSEQNVAAWCREHEIKEHLMRYWLKQLAPSEAPAPPGPEGLSVAVRERATASETEGLLVHVGHATVEVQAGFDRALLADVIETLMTRC